MGTTIFTVMSALATEYDAVNLGQGYPDYSMSDELIALVAEAMKNGFNQYVPMQGYLPLREALAQKVQFLYGTMVSPESQITITPGGTYAIYTALTTVLRPGDEVIVFEPAYDSYIPNIEVNGAVPIRVDLKFPEYKIDWGEVREKLSPRTKLIMLNSPHNPTGSVLMQSDLEELRSIVAGTNIFICSDEVYEHLIFDDIPHQSILRYPDLLERSFVCFSFGKVYHCTGWKLGYCVSSSQLTTEFRKVHQFNCFSCNAPAQVGLSKFIVKKDSYLSLPSFMQRKRDYFLDLMKQTRFKMLESRGSYFICASYERMSEESDKDFCVRITKEYGVTTIPLSVFYRGGTDNKVVRFCFAKKDETLYDAVERLASIA